MSMSRKDFEMFAEAFAEVHIAFRTDRDMVAGIAWAVSAFMDVCEEINPRFDRDRFKTHIRDKIRGEEE